MKSLPLRGPLHDFSQNPIYNEDLFHIFMKKGNKNKELTTIIIFFGRLYEYSIRNKDLFVKTHKKCTLFSFCWLFFDEFANGQICFCFFLTLPISC
jgi:hypothetical protein